MPLFKATASKAKPKAAIDYITDPHKAAAVDVLNLSPDEDYASRFEATAAYYGKNGGYGERKYYHFKLSPSPTDKVTAEQCQAAAMDLARRLFADYECVIATHTDSGVIHSHIIVNSVSFVNGLKLHVDDDEYGQMKDIANAVGRKHGMSAIDWRKKSEQTVTAAEQRIILRGGVSWKDELREVIDLAKERCDNIVAFEDYLADYGITMPRCNGNTVSYLHPLKEKAIRGERLGEGYTAAALEQSFSAARPKVTAAESLAATSRRLGGTAYRDYCNALTAKTELKLYIASAAVGAKSDKDFIASLAGYGIKADGDTYIMPDGRHISAATIGGEWSNFTEVKNNVIDKQDNRTYGGGRTTADGRAASVDSGGRTRDGERRTADATRHQQAATASSYGLREGDGQIGRIGTDNGREPAGTDKHIPYRHGAKVDSAAQKTGGKHGGNAGADGGNAYGTEHSERDGKRRS